MVHSLAGRPAGRHPEDQEQKEIMEEHFAAPQQNQSQENLKPIPKITLRPFEASESDAEAFMTWASDPRVTRFQRRGPYATASDALHYITEHILPHPWYRAICVDGRPVGSISVKPAPGDDRCRASVGYRLASDFWGRGIATAALREAAATVFEEWPHLERLEAVADVQNPASQRVLEKAGFQREVVLRKYIMLKGESRDMIMFSLLATDPRT